MRILLKRMASLTVAAALLSGLMSAPAMAAPPELKIDAKSAILLDYATGQVLYQKDADITTPPASLTKLMTLHLAYKRIAEGAMKPEDKVVVKPEAWAAKMPGSSVMFLAPGQNVTVAEVMRGIAIPSGNDASVALAQHMAGSVDAFVSMMNKEAKDMGYKTLKFTDPAGLNATNMVSAREFADFARRYVQMHPQALKDLHSVVEYRYPMWENLSNEEKIGKTQATYQPILQYNRNGLLGNLEGVDGLKTGFIEESGYNIAVTAQRGEMRLVSVILGVQGRDEKEGSRNREQAAAAALNWGFANFATVKPKVENVAPVRVWKGAANEVTLAPVTPVTLTVAKGQETKVTSAVQQEKSVVAPVKKGDKLGELIYSADGKEIARVPLVAANEVPQGGIIKRLWDSLRIMVSSWFSKK